MKSTVIYVRGKNGSADEAEHYKPLFEGCKVIGFDYKSTTPWEAKEEFPPFFEKICGDSDSVILIANSIGAYFSLCALNDMRLKKAFLISPIVDMEKLITNMMNFSGVTENELEQKREIPTDFGETLSWEYLQFARKNPITWSVSTCILYGKNDELTSYDTVSDFAGRIGGQLTVMKNGEHWFHTDEQMKFLDEWIKKSKE